MVLTSQLLELKSELSRLYHMNMDLEQKLKVVKKKEEELEKKEEELEKKEEELEKKRRSFDEQEKDLAKRTLQIKEKEDFLQRWNSELVSVQEKWDRYVRKPHIKILRLFYKILKVFWKALPETVRKPIRTRLKGKLSPSATEANRIEARSYQLNQTESTAQDRSFLTSTMAENRDRVKLGILRQPKVSVVLPVYNQSYLVEEAIKSVLNQTYPNLELIIVNDGSTDRVNDILPRYGFHDKVKILNQENQGLPRALSNGFRYASGTLFTWTSADNLMLPNQVETLVDFLLRNPHVDMVYSNVEIIGEDASPLLNSHYRRHNQYPPGSNQIYLPYEVETLGSIEDNFINASFLYRANVGKAIGEYDPCLLGTEDYDYWLRVNSLFTIRHLDSNEILYRYRVHADSLSEKYGESKIFENARVLIKYHRQRESYYNNEFDVIILGNRIQHREGRYYRFALESRNHGHNVIWGILSPGRAAEVVRKEGMVEVFIGKAEPERVKENLFKQRQYDKALVILTTSFERAILEPLKGEDIFIYYDLETNEDVEPALLEFVDAISSKSQRLLDRLSERFRNKTYLIRDGLGEERILRKARDNFYRLFEYPLKSGKILVYYGPLKKDFFDRNLFEELITEKRDWNFVLIGEPGMVDKDLIFQLGVSDNVYFLGEKPCGGDGNLYQNLSNASVIWAPIKSGEKYEELIQRLIEIASLSGRPILVPDGLDFSDVPFVFSFRDAKDCASILDVLTELRIDKEIFDRWIARNSWKEMAKWFTAIANNRLYYRKTREPIKKDRGLFESIPTVYRPNEGKVNVLIQARSLDRGGLEEVILNLVSHFDYRKVNILILCEEKEGHIADKCRDLGFMVKVLGREEKKEKEYREILKRYSIGVVNAHYATFGMKMAHEMGIPVVPVIHNTYVWLDDEEVAYFKACDRYVSKYIAVSEKVARYTTERFGVHREKIQVIPNGLDALKHERMREKERTISRASLGIDDQDFVFLNVATFDGRKGHYTLLGALKRMGSENSRVKVVCVGNIADLKYFSNLKENIQKYRLEKHIILHDYVEETASLYQLADAFVLPSLIEGWSISVMEAMFYGLPLILTDVGGNGEIIRDIGNGLLIPTSYGDILKLDYRNLGKYCTEEEPENRELLAKAMRDFCDRREYWKERGERGREAVQNRYHIDKVARAYEEVFFQILKERPILSATL
jgi:glycosyltransferase involved in cell wall biosynthesis